MVCAEAESPFVTTLTSSPFLYGLSLDLRNGTGISLYFTQLQGLVLEGCLGTPPILHPCGCAEGRPFVLDGELLLRGWLEGGRVCFDEQGCPLPRARCRAPCLQLIPKEGLKSVTGDVPPPRVGGAH